MTEIRTFNRKYTTSVVVIVQRERAVYFKMKDVKSDDSLGVQMGKCLFGFRIGSHNRTDPNWTMKAGPSTAPPVVFQLKKSKTL